MTLTIHQENDDQRQLLLTVEVEEKRVEHAMRTKARELSRQLHIPGFRRGKVPYGVLVRRIGKETLRAETIEELVQPIFLETMEQIDAEPYAQPQLDDIEPEPLVLKFMVPLEPEVALGDYRSLRKEIEPIAISDEAVDEAVERIQERHQTLEPVDRAVEMGDMVTVAGHGVVAAAEVEEEAETEADAEEETAVMDAEEETAVVEPEEEVLFDNQNMDFVMDPEKLFPGTSFVENLIGLVVGEEKSFDFVFPDDYEEEDLQGRVATFELTVLNVQRRELPAIDDELAQLEGDYETLADLRASLRKNLETQAESEAKDALIEGMVDDLLEDLTIVYPPAAVEAEIDGMVEEFKNQVTRSGWEWEDFQKIQGMDEATMRNNFRENAETQLRRRLALRQFIVDEMITIEAADIDAAIDERVKEIGDNEELRENMANFYREGYGFDMLSSEILVEKAYERIKAILSGTAPSLEEIAAAAEAAETADFEEE